MKSLPIEVEQYKALLSAFGEWLDVLGYAKSTRYNLPVHIREFFNYLERRRIYKIDYVNNELIKQYYDHLQIRGNHSHEGALSKNSLNKHQQALKKFGEFLRKHGKSSFPVRLRTEKIYQTDKIKVLSQSEILELFEATDKSHKEEHYRLRDKAILVVFYSCGLRRNEGVQLKVKDVLFDKERIYVKHGKNYKERMVPVNGYNLRLLEDYIYEGRAIFKGYNESEHLFTGRYGGLIQGQTLLLRLKAIVAASDNDEIKTQSIGLHTLRHSIATHLLQQGMDIKVISQFLGHSSLESTQIYTHLMRKL